MSKSRLFTSLIVGLCVLLLVPAVGAQTTETPVVYGIFFYSPSCPHCHDVIDNHWGGFNEEFGDQLQVLFINVQTPLGSELMQAARTSMNIESNGVPMLIIGEAVLVGSGQIPEFTPYIVREGLADGGIGYPPIPGIDEIFEAALEQEAAETGAAEAEAAPQQDAEPLPGESIESRGANSAADTGTRIVTVGAVGEISVLDRVMADPIANVVAVLVLLGLVSNFGVVAAGLGGWLTRANTQLLARVSGRLGWVLLVIASLVGLGLTFSLSLGSVNASLPVLVLAIAEVFVFLTVFAVLATHAGNQPLPKWLLPLVALAGLLVAGYLAYVELTLSEAVCGMVGDCNTVQQSPYAQIGGVPIGVLGVVGYAILLGLWLVNRVVESRVVIALELVVALVGVAFSAYLTFLEPFVIGASCAWCLTSAITMLVTLLVVVMLFWQSSPSREREQVAAKA